jgi:hypothetical protein
MRLAAPRTTDSLGGDQAAGPRASGTPAPATGYDPFLGRTIQGFAVSYWFVDGAPQPRLEYTLVLMKDNGNTVEVTVLGEELGSAGTLEVTDFVPDAGRRVGTYSAWIETPSALHPGERRRISNVIGF